MELLDRYELDRLLRADPGGDWWLAHHTSLGSQHLVRVCPADAPAERAELAHSVKIQAKILHPNLLRATDTVDSAGRFAAVYDKVPTLTLAERLQNGPLAPTEILPFFRALLSGVEALHSQATLHLDLSPARIFWCDGNPKIADCRYARHEGLGSPPPRSGNPAYMAPELLAGQADARADIYALGCIAYELHTGVPLFRGSPTAIAEARRVVPELSSLPPSWITLLDRCLRPDPAARYPHLQNLIRAVDELRSPRAVPVLVQEEADLLIPPVVAPVARNRTPAAPVRTTSGGETPSLASPAFSGQAPTAPPAPPRPPEPLPTYNPPPPRYVAPVEEEEETGIRWVPVLGILAVLTMGLVTCMGIAGAFWYYQQQEKLAVGEKAAVPSTDIAPSEAAPEGTPVAKAEPTPAPGSNPTPEVRPKKKQLPPGEVAPAPAGTSATPASPPPSEEPATATGNLKIEFWGELLPNAVEATCRGGYRARSPVADGIARFEGMPMGIDCLIFPKGAATTAASVRAGRDYKCEVRGSTTRCQ